MLNENIFIKYMEDRFEKTHDKPIQKKGQLPFITISREYGCQANAIAECILEKLRVLKISTLESSWRLINKEIIKESATELNLKESQIKYVFDSEERTTMDEIMAAISSRYYKSDKKIRKTISEVITTLALEGNSIIVGRAGVAITKDFKNSLHVKLVAPIKNRVNSIVSRKQMTEKEAKKFITQMDEKREKLVSNFYGHPTSMEMFDVIYNTSTLTHDEIAQSIVNLMIDKKLIKIPGKD